MEEGQNRESTDAHDDVRGTPPEVKRATRTKRVRNELLCLLIIAAGLVPLAMHVHRMRIEAPFRNIGPKILSSLGAIRSAERKIHARTGQYVAVKPGALANSPDDANPGLGLDITAWEPVEPQCWSVTLDPQHEFIARFDATAMRRRVRHRYYRQAIVEMRASGQVRYSYDGGMKWTPWE